MQKSFYVRAVWDEVAEVFYSDSDIRGLHIEAKTPEEFEAVLKDTAAELILANHISPNELATLPMRDLIPTILWQKPEIAAA